MSGGCIASSLPTEPMACTLDRWVNGRAVVKLGDGQEFVLARRHLPRDLMPGDHLELHIHTPASGALKREELARAVLKEILQG